MEGLKVVTDYYSKEELNTALPELSDSLISKLYISEIPYHGLIYVDCEEKILFETTLFKTDDGFKFIKPDGVTLNFCDYIEMKKSEYKNQDVNYIEDCMIPSNCKSWFRGWLEK